MNESNVGIDQEEQGQGQDIGQRLKQAKKEESQSIEPGLEQMEQVVVRDIEQGFEQMEQGAVQDIEQRFQQTEGELRQEVHGAEGEEQEQQENKKQEVAASRSNLAEIMEEECFEEIEDTGLKENLEEDKVVHRKKISIRKRLKNSSLVVRDKIYEKIAISYGPTSKGMKRGMKLVVSLLVGGMLGIGVSDQIPDILFVLGIALVTYLVIGIVNGLICILRYPFRKYSFRLLIYLIFAYSIIQISMYMGCVSGGMETNLVIVSIILTLGVFFRSIHAVLFNRKRNVLVFATLIGSSVIIGGLGLWLIKEGEAETPIKQYREMNPALLHGTRDASSHGTYNVEIMDFGEGDYDSIKTERINLESYVSYDGLAKKVRDSYWGYGLDHVPLAGRIWLPNDGMKHKAVFMIHGNHNMVTKSYLGYAYLGEYLAGRGYILISLDESMLNGYSLGSISNENDARAVMLLEAMKQLLEANRDEKSPLYQRIDESALAIAGHSRGGEAVAIAALFNQLDCYPGLGSIEFDYHFNIETVIAIAPTSDQYRPGGRDIQLEDINYFLIHGTNDQDVTTFMGLKQYNNVTFTDGSTKQKAYLYIGNANHGQFNTMWGRYDTGFPGANFLNTASLLEPEDQRTVLEEYVKTCLDVSLNKDISNEGLLYDCESYGSNLPETIYYQGYQKAGIKWIATYEEDTRLDCGTMENSKITAKKLYHWSEEDTNSLCSYYCHNNHAVELKWRDKSQAYYRIQLSDKCKGNTLQFDLVDLLEKDKKNLETLNMTIVISDQYGRTKEYDLCDYQVIYPPLIVKLNKLDYLFGKGDIKHCFQTVSIPLDDVGTEIAEIEFRFNKNEKGHIMLDNIGVSE